MDALIHGVMDWLPGDGGQPYLAPRRPVVDAWATPLRASGLIILDLGTFPRAGESGPESIWKWSVLKETGPERWPLFLRLLCGIGTIV